MTPELLTALCTGLVSIIAAVGSLLAAIRNGWALALDAQEKRQRLEEIHGLVNSRLSHALAEIANLRRYVSELTGQPADQAAAAAAAVDMKSP